MRVRGIGAKASSSNTGHLDKLRINHTTLEHADTLTLTLTHAHMRTSRERDVACFSVVCE